MNDEKIKKFEESYKEMDDAEPTEAADETIPIEVVIKNQPKVVPDKSWTDDYDEEDLYHQATSQEAEDEYKLYLKDKEEKEK